MEQQGNPETSAATLEEQLAGARKAADLAEQRRRDTQAAYTKNQQRLKAIEAEKKLLEEKVGSLSVKETEELEALKAYDPDAWYEKRKELELQSKQKLQQELSDVSIEASREAELERRAQLLEEFNASHPGFELTDQRIQLDVPGRFTAQLEKGEISFEQFLDSVHNYLNTPKVVGDGNKTLGQPDLGKLGGGDLPTKATTAVDIVASYKKEIF